MEKILKVFVSHMNAYWKVTWVWYDFNKQVDKMTYSVDSSQLYFMSSAAFAQWSHEQSGHGDKDGAYA